MMNFDEHGIEDLHLMRQIHIGRLLQQVYRQFNQQAIAMLQERGHQGLTLAHIQLLSHLDVEGNRITVLAERAGITKQSMGQLVTDLEDQRYIERKADPSDRRASLVFFTDRGWEFLQHAYAVWREIEADYQSILGEAEMRQLRASLAKLSVHFKGIRTS
ncbi:MarR family winged helix-turn-helix transcriptional regulator [Dictyobacter arantiisoli]|nr:MarR family winged helix-turn-helix transcriptional regulator [Dictyobacter arantiisoli]